METPRNGPIGEDVRCGRRDGRSRGICGSRRRRGVTRLLRFTSVLRSQPQQKNLTQRDVLESVTG